MNIHEYQGKAVLKSFGAPVPRGFPAFTTEEAIDAAARLGGTVWAAGPSLVMSAGGRIGGRAGAAPSVEWNDEDRAAAKEDDVKQRNGDQ